MHCVVIKNNNFSRMTESILNKNGSKYLVIGSDSLLGKAVIEHLKRSGQKVVATTRRSGEVSASSLFLDLSEDISSWDIPEDVDKVFLCASVTKMAQCREQPEESRRVNVDNMLLLAARLSERGISIIYPSTSPIFDGQEPNKKAVDDVCPAVEYGRQKVAAEKGILSIGDTHSIIRFTKILGPDNPLINDWIAKLKRREVIRPFSDVVLAPLHVDFAAQIMIAVAQKEGFGVWQASAEKDITYEELARYIAAKFKVEDEYVQPISIHESGIILESVAKHTTLDTTRLERELAVIRPDVWATIDSLYGL